MEWFTLIAVAVILGVLAWRSFGRDAFLAWQSFGREVDRAAKYALGTYLVTGWQPNPFAAGSDEVKHLFSVADDEDDPKQVAMLRTTVIHLFSVGEDEDDPKQFAMLRTAVIDRGSRSIVERSYKLSKADRTMEPFVSLWISLPSGNISRKDLADHPPKSVEDDPLGRLAFEALWERDKSNTS